MKSKVEAPLHILFVLQALERAHRGIIGRDQDDGAREFSTKKLKKYYMEVGIASTTSPPHMPSGSSFAERAVRTIIEEVREALLHSNLPNSMWSWEARDDALKHNAMPRRANRGSTSGKLLPMPSGTSLDSFLWFDTIAFIILNSKETSNQPHAVRDKYLAPASSSAYYVNLLTSSTVTLCC